MSINTNHRQRVWREPDALAPGPALCDHQLLHALLCARGVKTREQADIFLRPSRAPLGDPNLLPDMALAVALIRDAIANGRRIAIFGDYDVDGIASTAMLARALRRLGGDPLYTVPHRFHDGYGLNRAAVERFIANGARLLICVDCGSSNAPELEHALEHGLQAIVLDHHQVAGALPPEVAFVSAMRPTNAFPATNLATVGLVYTLLRALLGDAAAEMYLPYVALGTVADVAELRGINRALVARGISKMRRWRLPGMMALCVTAGVDLPTVRAWEIGYALAPRLNAAGRMESPQPAIDLLLADTAEAATPLAQRLDTLNRLRREETMLILDAAEAQVAAMGAVEHLPALVVGDAGWSIGLVGLVAARLSERYHLSTVVLEQGRDVSRGSARAPHGVDLMEALRATAPLLTRFGGHRRAAGLTLPTERVSEFRSQFCAAISRGCDGDPPTPELRLDAEIEHADLRLVTVDMLDALEPFGAGNEPPLLLMRDLALRSCRPSASGQHLILRVRDRMGVEHKGIFFRAGERYDELRGCSRVDLAAELRRNVWRGRASLELRVSDFRPSG